MLLVGIFGVVALLVLATTAPFNSDRFATLFPKSQSQAAECTTSLQSKINAAPSGGTVTADPCIYRESLTISKPITLLGQVGSEVRGSDVWTGWTQSGSLWVSNNTVPGLAQNGECEQPRCLWPEQVYINGNSLLQVDSGATPSVGQFKVDGSRKVWIADNPSGKTVEVTTRQRWATIQSANVTIKNMTFQHAGIFAQQGAIQSDDNEYLVLDSNRFLWSHGANLQIYCRKAVCNGIRIINNEIAYGGNVGIDGGMDNGSGTEYVLIQGNKIHHNNYERGSNGWHAGGIKLVGSKRVMIDNNEFYDNYADAIWCDIDCGAVRINQGGNPPDAHKFVISNNRIHDNYRKGIMFEISNGTKIYGNKLWNNAREDGQAIKIASSSNAEIYNNVLAWNQHEGIGVFSQYGDLTVQKDNVHDNVIITDVDSQYDWALGFVRTDTGGTLLDAADNSGGANNKFFWSNAPSGHCKYRWGQYLNGDCYSTISSWNGTRGGGGNSSEISSSEASSILAANCMPATPGGAVPTGCGTSSPLPSPSIAPSPSSAASPAPYGGTAASIPGTIEAEKYDLGGEGSGYHDLDTANVGGAFRTDGVDIKQTFGSTTDYTVGWTQAGEWLKYSVNVTQSGYYNIGAKVAALGGGGTFHIEVDGVNKTGTITIPDTQNWDTQQTVNTPYVQLSQGAHTLRIVFDTNGAALGGFAGDLNSITFSFTGKSKPFGGIAKTAPTTVQAEDYDEGGEGAAYHDTDTGNNGSVYRQDDVDVKATTDTGGGNAVGWFDATEWLNYTLNIPTTGTYTLNFRVGSPDPGRQLTVSVNGVQKGVVSVPQMPDWDQYQTVSLSNISLAAGTQTIQVSSNGFTDFNYFTVTTPQASPSPSPTKQGDIDKDGDVDIFDYNVLLTDFGKTGSGLLGDINRDNKVDIFDYNILLTNLGK